MKNLHINIICLQSYAAYSFYTLYASKKSTNCYSKIETIMISYERHVETYISHSWHGCDINITRKVFKTTPLFPIDDIRAETTFSIAVNTWHARSETRKDDVNEDGTTTNLHKSLAQAAWIILCSRDFSGTLR